MCSTAVELVDGVGITSYNRERGGYPVTKQIENEKQFYV